MSDGCGELDPAPVRRSWRWRVDHTRGRESFPARRAARRVAARAGALAAVVVVLTVGGCSSVQHSAGWHRAGATGRAASGSPGPRPVDSRTIGTALVVRQLPVRLPVPLSNVVVFVDGTSLLVAGGLTSRDASTSAVVRVDLTDGHVSRAGRLVAPVHDAAGATVGGADLLFGGGTSRSVATVELVQPGQTGRVRGALPEPRSDLVATSSDGLGYVLAGHTGSRMAPEVLRTADGRSFHTVTSLPVPVRYPALAASAGRLWLFGGVTGTGAATDVVQRVDLETGTARVVGHLPRPLSHAAGFALGASVYLAGGRGDGGACADEILRVDPDGTATRVGTLPTPLSDAGVAVIRDVAYLVGGETPATVAGIVQIRAAGR